MSLTPQFNASTVRNLVGRTLKVCSSRHTAPLDKGDLVKVIAIRYGAIYIETVKSENPRAQELGRQWSLPMSCLSLTDVAPTDPPVPVKKPRMTAKRIAEMRVSLGCTNYVQQVCQMMGYDFAAITPEKMKELVEIYNAPTRSKSFINKSLFDYFAALPAKSKLGFDTPELNVIDKALVRKTDNRHIEIDKLKYQLTNNKRIIKDLDSNIDSYQREIKNYIQTIESSKLDKTQRLANIENFEKQILEITNRPMGDLRIENYANMSSAIKRIKLCIIDLVNNSSFYNLESIQVPDNGELQYIKIIFRTNDIWLGEANNAKASKINMGSFLVKWTPFMWLEDYVSVPDRDDRNYNDFLWSMLRGISITPHANNIDVGSHVHPHVSGGGTICWGNAEDTVRKGLSYTPDFDFIAPEKAFIALRELLKTYNSDSPYISLTEFRRKQNPQYLQTLDKVHERKSRCTISLDLAKWSLHRGVKFDVTKIHPNTISRYLDANGKAASPELKDKHCYIDVHTYHVVYLGTSAQPKDERGKHYFKLVDNSFLLVDTIEKPESGITFNSFPFGAA